MAQSCKWRISFKIRTSPTPTRAPALFDHLEAATRVKGCPDDLLSGAELAAAMSAVGSRDAGFPPIAEIQTETLRGGRVA